jgi:hypothetical protein
LIGINEAAKQYNLPPLTATLHLINDIKKYNKIDGLKKELSALNFQKYAINEFCSSRSQVIMALMNLKNHGITEERILCLSNTLENNGYEAVKSNS